MHAYTLFTLIASRLDTRWNGCVRYNMRWGHACMHDASVYQVYSVCHDTDTDTDRPTPSDADWCIAIYICIHKVCFSFLLSISVSYVLHLRFILSFALEVPFVYQYCLLFFLLSGVKSSLRCFGFWRERALWFEVRALPRFDILLLSWDVCLTCIQVHLDDYFVAQCWYFF